jgi:integrase
VARGTVNHTRRAAALFGPGDHQARQLLAAPARDIIKAKRDRAILLTLLYHALRREELCKLKVSDFNHARRGVPHFKPKFLFVYYFILLKPHAESL